MPAILRKQLGFVMLAHLASYAVVNMISVSPDEVWMIALLLAEHSLLYIWAGSGTGRWLPRLAVAYGVSVLMWSLPAVLRGIPLGWVLAFHCTSVAMLMATVIAPLAVARANGFRLQRFCREGLPEAKAFQISIRAMLVLTVVVACLLAFATSLDDSSHMRGRTTSLAGQSHAVMMVTLPILFLGSAMLSVWASLSAGAVCSRILVGSATLVAGGAFLPFALNGDAASYGLWVGLPLLTFLITSATLLVFRSIGYRFVRETPREGANLGAESVASEPR